MPIEILGVPKNFHWVCSSKLYRTSLLSQQPMWLEFEQPLEVLLDTYSIYEAH